MNELFDKREYEIVHSPRGLPFPDPDPEQQCPACGFGGDLDEFETAGACFDCVFCPVCNCEHTIGSGERHDHNTCKECQEWINS